MVGTGPVPSFRVEAVVPGACCGFGVVDFISVFHFQIPREDEPSAAVALKWP
jgi:hypothetical protein